jgi:peptidoglycan-N-acetylglucosamine deacetylase
MHADAPERVVTRRTTRRHRLLFAVVIFLGLPAGLQVRQMLHVSSYGADTPICRVLTSSRAVALTFDDGPDPRYTGQVLSLLAAERMTASFFLTGEHASASPELVAAEIDAGMEIGDHSWSHPHLSELDIRATTEQIERTRALLARLGADVGMFRAPFGEIAPDQLELTRRMGLLTIHWSLPFDHLIDGRSPEEAADTILDLVEPGDIILAHDANAGSIDRDAAMRTLHILLPELRARGFAVVSVGELLEMGTPVRADARPWFWQTGFNCPDG